MSVIGTVWKSRVTTMQPRLYSSPQVALVAYIDSLRGGDFIFVIDTKWVDNDFWYDVLYKRGRAWMTSQDVVFYCQKFSPHDETVDDITE